MPATAADRRTLIADAAISTLADGGMRGFTHRAVDRAAGLAEGSTSYYFRTRQALLHAALSRMAELDQADVDARQGPPGADGPLELDTLATIATDIARRWLTEGRQRTLARYELMLEAGRRPDLRAKMTELSTAFRAIAQQVLEAAGAPHPDVRAIALVTSFDGVVLHQLAGQQARQLDEDELFLVFRDMIRAAIAAD